MREREREREREKIWGSGLWPQRVDFGREREREDSENWKKKKICTLERTRRSWNRVSLGSIWVWFGSILVTKVGVLVF